MFHKFIQIINNLDGINESNLSCIPEPAINRGLLREQLHAFSVIPARFKHILTWRAYVNMENRGSEFTPRHSTIRKTKIKS
ncbi:MAG: hypothetical protein WBZ20_06835 [Nitrososphaeraceae archaeon]